MFLRILLFTMTTGVTVSQDNRDYVIFQSYRLDDDPIMTLDVTINTLQDQGSHRGSLLIRCPIQCSLMNNCKSFSIKKDLSR